MKRNLVAVTILLAGIILFPFGNDVQLKFDVKVKHPVKVQTKATMEQKTANKILAMRYAKAGFGWDLKQRQCVHRLFTKESRFDHLAKSKSSSAAGIAQMLKEQSTDPAIQILNAYRYIVHRYGTPCKALSHHLSRNWY